LVGYGSGVQKALDAAAILGEQGHTVTVADARFAKPLDRELLLTLAADHELLMTIEEGCLPGGFGSAVLELLSEHTGQHQPTVLRVGVPDRYVTHGKPALLHEEIGFTGGAIAARVLAALTADIV
jgi:1-deoxy-D-xylulose-5-phosphate synthase